MMVAALSHCMCFYGKQLVLEASSRQRHVLFDLQTLHMCSLHLQRQAMFVQRILSHFQADHETSVSIS